MSTDTASAFAEPLNFAALHKELTERYTQKLRERCSAAHTDEALKLGKDNALFYATYYLGDTFDDFREHPEFYEDDGEEDPEFTALFGKSEDDEIIPVDPCECYPGDDTGAMLYAWKLAKNTYQIDRDALPAILSAPAPEKLCLFQLLNRFREYCIYISFDWRQNSYLKYADDSTDFVKGVFVQLDGTLAYDIGKIILKLMIVTGGKEDGAELLHKYIGSRDDMFGGIGAGEGFSCAKVGEPQTLSPDIFSSLPEFKGNYGLIGSQVMKVLAYILADNHDLKQNGAEIDWTDKNSMRPGAKKVKGGIKFFPLDKSSVYTLGQKLGDEVRARAAKGAAPESIKGHFTAEVENKGEKDTLSFALDE